MIEILPNWHPVFVHFPLALIPLATVCFIGGMVTRGKPVSKELFAVAKWCLWFAALFTLVTATTGWLAFDSVYHSSEAAHQAMKLHRLWALSTAGLIILCALGCYIFRRFWGIRGNIFVFLILLLLLSLVTITGWLGAEVVYRQGVGVLAMPHPTEEHHHHHQEGIGDEH